MNRLVFGDEGREMSEAEFFVALQLRMDALKSIGVQE